MNIDLSKYKIGDIFTIQDDERFFKKLVHHGVEFYVYALFPDATKFALDNQEAKRLCKKFGIDIIYSKIILCPTDNLFIDIEKRKRYNFYNKMGVRYIAEAKIIYNNKEITRVASAGADNVEINFLTYCPEIACRRAEKKCIIDALGLEEIMVDWNVEIDKDKIKIKEPNKKEKTKDKIISKAQLNMIKTLHKSLNKKFVKSKYEKISFKEAKDIINNLKNKIK